MHPLKRAIKISSVPVTIGLLSFAGACPDHATSTEVVTVNSLSLSVSYDSTYVGDSLSLPVIEARDETGRDYRVSFVWRSSNPGVVKIIGDTVTSSDAAPPRIAGVSEGDAVITAVLAAGTPTSQGAQLTYRDEVSVAGVPASIKISPSPISLQLYRPGVSNPAAYMTPVAIVKSASGRAINNINVTFQEVNGNGVAQFCTLGSSASNCKQTFSGQSNQGGTFVGLAVGATQLRATLTPVAGRTLPAITDVTNVTVGGGLVLVTSQATVPSIYVGDTRQFSALVRDASGATVSNPQLVWSVNRPTLATIDQTGKVTATAAGAESDTILVLATSPTLGITGQSTLHLFRKAAFVAITPGAITVKIGATARVNAHYTDASGAPVGRFFSDSPPNIDSDNHNIAIVRQDGDTAASVTGVAVGTTTIIASFGNITASIPVIVVPSIVTAALQFTSGGTTRAYNTNGESIAVGATAKLVVVALDANGTPFTDQFTFTTTSTGITLTPSGTDGVIVTGVTVGTNYQISVKAASDAAFSTTAKFAVTSTAPTGGAATAFTITSTPANGTTGIGGTVQFLANPVDANGNPASGCTVQWNTDFTSVGSINSNGLATGAGAGATAVRASCNGSNVGSAAKLTVTDATYGVTKIAITPKKYDFVEVNSTSQFAAVVTQTASGATAPITWSIDAASTTAGVTIDQTGKVTIPANVTGGGVTITAKASGQTDIAWLSYGMAGSMRGTITSTSGRYLAGSTATATPTMGGAQVSTTVDDNGQFYLVGLAPGSYSVFVSEQGVPASQSFSNIIVTRGNITPIVLSAFPIVH